MAKDKSSFVLYADYLETVSKLPDNKAGRLFKLILEYVNDKNPTTDDLLLQVAFEPIKQQLKRDLKQWEQQLQKRSEAGKAGGIKSGEKRRSKTKQNEAKRTIASKNEANEADNVTVTVNVNDNVKGNTETNPVIFSIEHCLTVAMKDERWVSANKATKEDLEEFNKMLEKRSIYDKNPKDYKTHFANWKAKGKKDDPVSTRPNGAKLSSIVKQIENDLQPK